MGGKQAHEGGGVFKTHHVDIGGSLRDIGFARDALERQRILGEVHAFVLLELVDELFEIFGAQIGAAAVEPLE